MKTRIDYMYRDASNYKFHGSAVVFGECDLGDFEPYLFDGEFFVPHEVGLDHLLNLPMNEDDHYLHSFCEFVPTAVGKAMCSKTELVWRFKIAHERGWFSSFE